MFTNTFEKKFSDSSNLKMAPVKPFYSARSDTGFHYYYYFFLFPYSFKAALRQNHEVSGSCLQGSFLQLSSLFLYSFKSPWLPFLPEPRVLELSSLFSSEKPFINLQPGKPPLKGPELEEKPKGKPDTSCETLDISVVLSFTFSICKMEEHSLQNSPSYLEPTTRSPSQFILTSLPHQFYSRLVFPFSPSSLSQNLLLGRSSQTSIPKKPLLSPL